MTAKIDHARPFSEFRNLIAWNTLIPAGASLVVFQATAFLVPWFAVLWLSHNGSLSDVADLSLLLAFISPLCLLLATPSRNYLLTSDETLFSNAIQIRLALSLAGLLVVAAIGWWYQSAILAIALYLSRNGEMFYDINIANLIKKKAPFELFRRALRKITIIVFASGVTFLTDSLAHGLVILGVLFLIDTLLDEAIFDLNPLPKRDVFLTALPLSLSALLFSVYFYVPRYILGTAEDHSGLAIFTISSFLVMLVLVINNALCQSQLAKWREYVATNQYTNLKKSLISALIGLIFLYGALQIFHIPVLSSLFWATHNALHTNEANLYDIYSLTLLLAIGPLLFSFANYFLIITHQHRYLLRITLINTAVTALVGCIVYTPFETKGLLIVVTLSGVLHFIVCAQKLKRVCK